MSVPDLYHLVSFSAKQTENTYTEKSMIGGPYSSTTQWKYSQEEETVAPRHLAEPHTYYYKKNKKYSHNAHPKIFH